MSRGTLLFALLLSAPAVAQDGPYDFTGDLRWIGSTLTDFPVDAEGTTHGQTLWLDQRIRAGVRADYGVWGWEAELDVLTGQLAGETWKLGDLDDRRRDAHTAITLDGLLPRKALFRGVVGDVQLEGGLTTSHWGLGVLSNDGAHDDLFGRTDLGDRVFRLRATWMPRKATPGRSSSLLSGAVDLVYDDGIASLYRNELAVQGIIAGLQATARGGRHGFYGVFRQQWDRDVERTTSVGVLDLYADHPVPVGSWTLRLAGEGVGIFGRTNRSTTYARPGDSWVMQLGASARATATDPSEKLHFHLQAGYASGDGNPDDAWQREYTFDMNHNVGLVLFDQFLGAVDARSYQLLDDPDVAPSPPDGADRLVREGAIHGATYLNPIAQTTPIEGLDVRIGGLFAWSNALYAHPFYTFRNGGVPVNQAGVETPGRYLGTEADWAIRYGRDVYRGLTPSFEVQGGHLFLGPALQGQDPKVIHHVMGIARLQW